MTDKAIDVLKSLDISSRVTGIGSVPFCDAGKAVDIILRSFSSIPYVPQLTKVDFRENMFLQFSENLPCLGVDKDKKQLFFDESVDMEKELEEFYDYISYNCYERFKISRDYSRGFYAMLDKCQEKDNLFIKTQITGPITYLFSITRKDKRSLVYDQVFADAITLGLAMKGLWQAGEIRKIGKKPILFFDEPSLWGLGSAYMPLSSEQVNIFIQNLISFIRERDEDLPIGLHCCGNTDWRMVFKSGVDIVSFDSYSFGDKIILYPQEIKSFIERGGVMAFGIVPTSEYKEDITEEALYEKFIFLLKLFERRGIEKNLLLDSSIFTPACGMGPLQEGTAVNITRYLSSLAKRIQDENASNRLNIQKEV